MKNMFEEEDIEDVNLFGNKSRVDWNDTRSIDFLEAEAECDNFNSESSIQENLNKVKEGTVEFQQFTGQQVIINMPKNIEDIVIKEFNSKL